MVGKAEFQPDDGGDISDSNTGNRESKRPEKDGKATTDEDDDAEDDGDDDG